MSFAIVASRSSNQGPQGLRVCQHLLQRFQSPKSLDLVGYMNLVLTLRPHRVHVDTISGVRSFQTPQCAQRRLRGPPFGFYDALAFIRRVGEDANLSSADISPLIRERHSERHVVRLPSYIRVCLIP